MFFNEINSKELKTLMKKNSINLIDIRDYYSYSLGTINNSINIPANLLFANPHSYLDKNKEYYIFCNSGNTSFKLCNYLSNLGYKVVNIIDGYMGYQDSI